MRSSVVVAYAALILAESICWFSALAVIGTFLGLGGSAILWTNLVILTGLGVFSAWFFGGGKGNTTVIAVYQAVVGLIIVYSIVASTSIGELWSFKIAWPVDMFGGTYEADGVAELVIALVASSLIWYRTQNLVVHGDIRRLLTRRFKLGTGLLAIALMVELNVGFSIGIKQVLLPFFTASLVGLAASRLPQSDDTGNASWPRVIAISVMAVIGMGLIGGLITGRYGHIGVRGLVALWGGFVDGLLWVLRWPIELFVRGLWALILWLRNVFGATEVIENEVLQIEPVQLSTSETSEQVEHLTHIAIETIRWPLSAVLIIVVFFMFVFAYRQYVRRASNSRDSNRESIRGDADATSDMMKLLSGLLPGWIKRNRERGLWRWPEGQPGVAEVFLLYFDALSYAIKRGMVFDPSVTPNERVARLSVFLPGAPIEILTNRFNEACYGDQPTDQKELELLRQAVDSAAKQPLLRSEAETEF